MPDSAVDPTPSPLRGRMIFNLGARRSGTYWLQRIVTAHPAVAEVPSETFLFDLGIAPLLERFHHGVRGSQEVARTYVERGVLLRATRDFCDRVLEGFLAGHERLAERTPQHVNHLGLIAEVYPDARFVHIVRDGRDVVRSLLAQSWEKGRPEDVEDAAREWAEAVRAGLAGRSLSGYVEVRYEDLLADPARVAGRLYEQLGLEVTPEIVRRAVTEAGIRLNVDASGSAAGAGKWREALGERELATVERVAGDVLRAAGYTDVAAPAAGPSTYSPDRAPRGPRGHRAPGLRRRAARAVRGGRGGRGPGGRPRAVDRQGPLKLISELLERVQDGTPERVADLLSPDVSIELVDDDTAGRVSVTFEELVAALRDDSAATGRQIGGDVYASYPTSAAVLTYELADSRRADRVVVLTAPRERIEFLRIYRLPVRPAPGP